MFLKVNQRIFQFQIKIERDHQISLIYLQYTMKQQLLSAPKHKQVDHQLPEDIQLMMLKQLEIDKMIK